MANSQSRGIVLAMLFIQNSIVAIAQPIQYDSNPRSISTITSTISFYNHDESFYASDNENSGGETYDDEDDFNDIQAPSTTNSQNMTLHLNKEVPGDIYDDETNSYAEEEIDEETEEPPMYGDTRSVDRPGFNRPNLDSNAKNPLNSLAMSQSPSTPMNFWTGLFSKPAILVGLTGGILIGMLSAILLIMFIIYRMRKKDEGSYVLEEAPRKSPSHAYTRVSSREFFA